MDIFSKNINVTINYTLDKNGNCVWDYPYLFEDTNQPRPECINPGCTNPVIFSARSKTGHRSIRTVCSHCHNVSFGHRYADGSLYEYKDGVTAHKKNYCENDSCTSTIHGTHQLELDHIDGNHCNNIPENVMTLCKNCHSHKSKMEGDFKKNKSSNQTDYKNKLFKSVNA